jgi:hypothetical protein
MVGCVGRMASFFYGFPRSTGHISIGLTLSGLQAEIIPSLIAQTLYMDRIGLQYMFLVHLARVGTLCMYAIPEFIGALFTRCQLCGPEPSSSFHDQPLAHYPTYSSWLFIVFTFFTACHGPHAPYRRGGRNPRVLYRIEFKKSIPFPRCYVIERPNFQAPKALFQSTNMQSPFGSLQIYFLSHHKI